MSYNNITKERLTKSIPVRLREGARLKVAALARKFRLSQSGVIRLAVEKQLNVWQDTESSTVDAAQN